ncbi:NUDIX domain-containing protein [Salinibacillus xinjiangensis]|uniref:NUDIX domain-containing protein n=1 Tax=Salinibacillus xinjiangensis TaxID=1229268 RepID=A0A6G1X653_9BACI|nr:NUDIX hydrolase [Salinibacillus xinjiangensis]MRG86481.1 NUDIX domain-containing protein [Salinibacillus xinjiangensis]
MKKFEEKTLQSETIFEGKVINLLHEEVQLPNGKTSKREIVKHPGAVAIIPVTKDNKIVMVEQYRKPLERSLVEIPAGKLEKGEEPKRTALRELEEETGYTSHELTHVISFYTSPGFADELIHLYIAKDLEKVESPMAPDEDEFVELMECTLEEANQLVIEQKIYDAKTAYAVLYLNTKGM